MEDVAAAYLEDAIEAARQTVSHHEMPARCILNIGGEYTFGPVTIGLDIHNLLGTSYNRSGMNTTLIPPARLLVHGRHRRPFVNA